MSDAEWARAPWNEPDARECPFCEGEGTVFYGLEEIECPDCNGTGVIYD